MAKIIKKNKEAEAGNVFWCTMSDMMLGLAVVFITLFVVAMTGFSNEEVSKKELKLTVTKKLVAAVQKKGLKVEIDQNNGDIKLTDVDLFEVNSWVLTPNGKKLLDELGPIYINTIFAEPEYVKALEQVLVEGHTDSQTFAGNYTKNEQFLKNMELSLKRAHAVADYMLRTKYDPKYADAVTKVLIVDGKSYNEPVLVNGKEDYGKSRRVVLKMKTEEMNIAKALGFE
ncbi:MAG: OmpA family protein [Alphaproteobacteria bacterium]|nr:OmpA family protein [Alphaproteobacteria bacterium]